MVHEDRVAEVSVYTDLTEREGWALIARVAVARLLVEHPACSEVLLMDGSTLRKFEECDDGPRHWTRKSDDWTVSGCARCGGNHHVNWREFTHPVVDADGTTWTHWTPCPTNGEPILMAKVPVEEGRA